MTGNADREVTIRTFQTRITVGCLIEFIGIRALVKRKNNIYDALVRRSLLYSVEI